VLQYEGELTKTKVGQEKGAADREGQAAGSKESDGHEKMEVGETDQGTKWRERRGKETGGDSVGIGRGQ
jgi:hypothetical protein